MKLTYDLKTIQLDKIQTILHSFYYILLHWAKITHQLSSGKILECSFSFLSIHLHTLGPSDDQLFVNSHHSTQALLKQKVRNMESFFSPRRIWPSSYYLQVLKQVISTWTNYWKRVPWVEPCYPIMVMSTVAQERGLKTLTFKIKEVVDLFLADYFFWLYYYQFFVFSKLLFLFFLIFLIGRLRDCKTVLANSSMWMYLDESTY